MKKTSQMILYPLSKGLDLTSIPGVQDKSALKKAKNAAGFNRPSLRKRPGHRRLPYIGQSGGVQGAIHWFATTGAGQSEEIVRVRSGRIEALRDADGGKMFIDLGVQVSPTDRITFERYANILIIHFENSDPLYYTMGGSLNTLPILPSHAGSPPTFSRVHGFRLWYGGRRASPHTLYVSAIADPGNYSLLAGGFSMSVRDGDGDPVGLTGLSPSFRGNLFAYKWGATYRIYNSGYGYGIDELTSEAGAVHHNAITGGENDIYSVDVGGIRSIGMTDKYGAAEPFTMTYPIYEWFQEDVNWSAAQNMILLYDAPTNTLLLSYVSSGSSVNNRVLAMNVMSKQFYTWEDVEYEAIGRYWEYGKKRTFVSDYTDGICVLDKDENTLNGRPIDLDCEFGLLFPMGNPKARVSMTNGWLLAKPTDDSVSVTVSYALDGAQAVDRTVDTSGGQYGAEIGSGIIGTEIIGSIDENIAVIPFECVGECGAITFRVRQEPPENDASQPCEIYGIIAEFDYDEDSEVKVTM